MWHSEGIVRTEVLEGCIASMFRVERISELVATLAVTNSHTSSFETSVSRRSTADIITESQILSTLKIEATHFSETSVIKKGPRRHIPVDGILLCCTTSSLAIILGLSALCPVTGVVE
jgi:hypothetical protein